MRLTQSDIVIELIIAVLFASMIVGHLSLAFLIGLRSRWLRAWKPLGGLSIVTSLVWLFVGMMIGLLSVMPSRTPGWYYIYRMSFGLPVNTIPTNIAMWVSDRSAGVCFYFMVLVIILASALYLVALLSYAFAKTFSHGSNREGSKRE